MCTDKEELKKAFTKIKELQEELKTTREDYLEEINALVEKIDNLENKIGAFVGKSSAKSRSRRMHLSG